MLEWLKRHAWKVCKRQKRFQGSNPCPSAKIYKNQTLLFRQKNKEFFSFFFVFWNFSLFFFGNFFVFFRKFLCFFSEISLFFFREQLQVFICFNTLLFRGFIKQYEFEKKRTKIYFFITKILSTFVGVMFKKYYKLFLLYFIIASAIVFILFSLGNCSMHWFETIINFNNDIDIASFVILLIFVLLVAIGLLGKKIMKDNNH